MYITIIEIRENEHSCSCHPFEGHNASKGEEIDPGKCRDLAVSFSFTSLRFPFLILSHADASTSKAKIGFVSFFLLFVS